jgi:hypothetical protein
MSDTAPPELVIDLAHWEVVLTTGEVVALRANGVAERGGCHVFVALMNGTPPYEYELCRFPAKVVDKVFGGWPEPRQT